VVKGSDPSRECQSYPDVLKSSSSLKQDEDFGFLKKEFDVPRRVAANQECTGVSVGKLKSGFVSGDADKVNGTDALAVETRPRTSSTGGKNEHNILMKEKLDTLLDKDVNVLESRSFFDLYDLGDVVSISIDYAVIVHDAFSD
jgi:hypothetical protein